MRIVVFGAGGRAGRAAVEEARRRGYRVTAVVRDPARYRGPVGEGIAVAAGDVTDPAGIAEHAAGHDAAIHAAAVYGVGTDPDGFFPAAAHALVTGLGAARVPRLVAVGLATLLPDADGTRLVDSASFPAEHRPFSLAHASGLAILLAQPVSGPVDWVSVSPAGDFDHEGPRAGGYVLREHADMSARITHPDFAIALLDEIDGKGATPAHHRVQVAVALDPVRTS
jgi:putative NADH-flavin reductase